MLDGSNLTYYVGLVQSDILCLMGAIRHIMFDGSNLTYYVGLEQSDGNYDYVSTFIPSKYNYCFSI